jgi:hypothetical protein
MTAPKTKPCCEKGQLRKPVQGKALEKHNLDDGVQVAVEDCQLAYLSDSAVVNFGLPPLAASLCSLARLRQLHYLHKIRLPKPRRKPSRGEAFEEVVDWIAERIPVQQEHLIKAHPKVVISHTQRVLDAEFEKLEKGVYLPSLASKAALLGHQGSDDLESAHVSSRSLDDLWYSFPASSYGSAAVYADQADQSPTMTTQPRNYGTPINSPTPYSEYIGHHGSRDQEEWHGSHGTSFRRDFIQAAPWSGGSFDTIRAHDGSPFFEMEGLSPETPMHHGRGLSPLNRRISPLVISGSANDRGLGCYVPEFPGNGEVASSGNVVPFFELPKSRRQEFSRSPPMLLQRQKHWNQAEHM